MTESSGLSAWVQQVLLSDLSRERRISYLCFGCALALSLGTGQFVVPVKQVLFYQYVGAQWDPVAKSLMLVVLLPVLFVYNLLVWFVPERKKFVLVVSALYAVIFFYVALSLAWSEEGGGAPPQWALWALYYATETKGVVIMPMLWSVIADVSTTELSRAAYPFIFALTEIGGVVGSFVAIFVRSLGGPIYLLLLQAVIFIVVALLNWAACAVLPPLPEQGSKAEALLPTAEASSGQLAQGKFTSAVKKAGAVFVEGVEGLWLLVSRPFAFMIFWVSYATLVPRTVLDYENSIVITGEITHPDEQVAFWGKLNLYQNAIITAVTLLGTRKIVEKLGVGGSLLVLPGVLLASVIAICVSLTFWSVIIAVVFASVVAFGLNSPCKEMLYVRTSKEIKYKAKSWSEMYGNNFMKFLGSQINVWLNQKRADCMPHCFHSVGTAAITSAWVAVWFGVALKAGQEYKRLEDNDETIS